MTTSAIARPRTPWRRLHLFELCDQPWLSSALRDAEAGYLVAAIGIGKLFDPLAANVGALMDRTGIDRIVDLASGGAGPWPRLATVIAAGRSGRMPGVTLTDLYPSQRARARATEALRYAPEPADARAVPASLAGIRTMFDGLHHLRPDDARAALTDAHRARAPIVIGEALSRRLGTVLTTVLIPLLVLLVAPRVRPISGWQLLFIYLIPVLPLIIAWDGLVSCLRTYRPAELLALTHGLDGYRWTAGVLRNGGGLVTYLIGEPEPAGESGDFARTSSAGMPTR